MNLKQRILKLIEAQKYTYEDLAKYLNISEVELDQAFDTNTIEIRTLELISKELRIPLYSFFRDPNMGFDYSQEPFYTTNIWGDNEIDNRRIIASLQLEISKLKLDIFEKDALIKKLQQELTKK
jgi:transcriptional regulator with XRE-family HTH domain